MPKKAQAGDVTETYGLPQASPFAVAVQGGHKATGSTNIFNAMEPKIFTGPRKT